MLVHSHIWILPHLLQYQQIPPVCFHSPLTYISIYSTLYTELWIFRKTEFIKWLTYTSRIRHRHTQFKNQVTEFVIQLETNVRDKWYPIIRYDTTHGLAHKDIIHFDGSTEKSILGMSNYNIAMTFVEQDLKSNCEKYIEQFLEEVKNYDRKGIHR